MRDYGIEPQVWGAAEGCGHEWGKENYKPTGRHDCESRALLDGSVRTGAGPEQTGTGQFCHLCGAWRGSLGLEPTVELYVQHIVEIFREVRRVLRQDGTLWLNLGDSYAGGNYRGGGIENASKKQGSNKGTVDFMAKSAPVIPPGLKPKDLIGVPWRVALALQNDGWWLRSDIVWSNANPMPESCTDRPTRAHEYIFLLTKSAHYFFDQEAVREGPQRNVKVGWKDSDLKKYSCDPRLEQQGSYKSWRKYCPTGEVTSRNLRSVWDIATAPFPAAHFATFPPEIPRRCIAAGTSERGACGKCGSPWKRVVGDKKLVADDSSHIFGKQRHVKALDKPGGFRMLAGHHYDTTTLGWRPTCTHYPRTDEWREYLTGKDLTPAQEAENECIRELRVELLALWEPMATVPATVLDPFFGAGTTGLVAAKMGRDCIGIEIKPEYCQMATKRIRDDLGMLVEITHARPLPPF